MAIVSERETTTHLYFLRGIFSNFQRCNLVYEGLTFPTTEHAFMWAKAKFFSDKNAMLKILKTDDPLEAKNIGREVKGYNDDQWNAVRYQFMLDINKIKYQLNPGLAKELLKTGTKTLVEANPRDTIWAVGLHAHSREILDSSKWKGLNLLGKLLMEIRDELRSAIKN